MLKQKLSDKSSKSALQEDTGVPVKSGFKVLHDLKGADQKLFVKSNRISYDLDEDVLH